MKISVNAVIQILSTAGQVVNLLGPSIPEKYKPWIATALGVIQTLTAVLSHYSNPDGTPATVAYQPK